jgi:hypothetical protein
VANDSVHYEHTVIDWWLLPSGLPVEMDTVKTSLTNSSLVGDVKYNETYHAVLLTATPMR